VTSLIILVPVALGLGMLGLLSFFWATRHEQFDDLDGAARRVLLDDEDE
jgi:cbb3-type cytochrome oxidase maturation protein